MKCISLWQPWASLIAIGAKSIETRSWPTSFRGRLAIHAARKWDAELVATCFREPFATALRGTAGTVTPEALPLGCIVATCRVVDCVRVPELSMVMQARNGRDVPPPAGSWERSFGDYARGRYAWVLADVLPLPEPMPWRGSQGLFEVPDAAIARARARETEPQMNADGRR